MTAIIELSNKDFKIAFINMLKKSKEIMIVMRREMQSKKKEMKELQ